ncbi:MAG: hypothetical protein MUC88_00015 [Planctomycetes bacterium]|jgi:hypothetical protein|nr:hypothetical protein [Planctomycetota bacterium]
MSAFVERIIWERLHSQVEELKLEPVLYEKFLIGCGLPEEEAKIGRERWEERPVSVVHGYARGGTPFPVIALVLGQESTAQDYIGEDGEMLDEDGMPYLDDHGNVEDPHVRRWEQRYDAYVYADHPDECLYLYQLAKHILVSGRSVFQAEGLDEITYSGAELAPDPRYMPSEMFTRRFSITLRADEEYHDPIPQRGTTIRGMVVADDEPVVAPGMTEAERTEAESVVRGVTVYTEEPT